MWNVRKRKCNTSFMLYCTQQEAKVHDTKPWYWWENGSSVDNEIMKICKIPTFYRKISQIPGFKENGTYYICQESKNPSTFLITYYVGPILTRTIQCLHFLRTFIHSKTNSLQYHSLGKYQKRHAIIVTYTYAGYYKLKFKYCKLIQKM